MTFLKRDIYSKNKYPKEIVTKREYKNYDELYDIYKPLINRMDKMPFIKIV